MNQIQHDENIPNRLLRLTSVKTYSGLPRSTLYYRIAQGLWTRPVKLSARCVGWPVNEVAALNAACIAGKSNDEIRALVKQLEISRKSVV